MCNKLRFALCVFLVLSLLLPVSLAKADTADLQLSVQQRDQDNLYTLNISRNSTAGVENLKILWPAGTKSLSLGNDFCEQPEGCEQEAVLKVGVSASMYVFEVQAPGVYQISVRMADSQPDTSDQLKVVFEAIYYELDLEPHSSVIDFQVEEGKSLAKSSILTNLGSPWNFSTALVSEDGQPVQDCFAGFEATGSLGFGEEFEFPLEVDSSCFELGIQERFTWILTLYADDHDCPIWTIRRGILVLVVAATEPPPPMGDERLFMPLVRK